jgi:hypothetical protein
MVNHEEQDRTKIFSLLKKDESLRIHTDGEKIYVDRFEEPTIWLIVKVRKVQCFSQVYHVGCVVSILFPSNFNSLPDIVEIFLSATFTIPSEHFAPITTVNVYTTI